MVSRDGRWRIEHRPARDELIVYATAPDSRVMTPRYRAQRLDLVLAWLAEQGVKLEDLREV